jgi:hypothetical protein
MSKLTKGKALSALALVYLFSSCGFVFPVTVEKLPPDMPMPAAAPSNSKWLREAIVLQPYGPSEYLALVDPGDRPQRLRKDFGFNAIIVQPPDSHNTVADAKNQLTEEQFRAGVAAYRAANYRLILYTSLMALGLSPEFQSGQVSREHPEWLQRDPKGNPVMAWGVPWLCPNTGAREAALARALRITREYQADGIMLDNNEFFFAAAGWTCHCAGCTKMFRNYARQRFDEEGCRRLFGAPPDDLKIPSEEGPLHALWLNWRNRAWAEINESFRARLRRLNPKILCFANTQYAYDNAMLGTDFQYEHEDVVLSESVSLSSRQMSEKMVLGHAMASGRPLWNYIGTFSKGDDYTGLKPASLIGPLIASTVAHGARPWIVDGFDLGPTDAAARMEMSRLIGWQSRHEEFYTAEPWAGVAAIISLSSRNVLHRPLIPPHISVLQSIGTPVIGLHDDTISTKMLRPFRVITIETAACLNDQSARTLAAWVRKGGVLIAARDAGSFDELGRKRLEASLWAALGLAAAPHEEVPIGRGKVLAPEPANFAKTASRLTPAESFGIDPNSGAEVVSYSNGKYLLLHIIRHLPGNKPLALHFPTIFHPKILRAGMFVPGSDETQNVSLIPGQGGAQLILTNQLPYCLVQIPLR